MQNKVLERTSLEAKPEDIPGISYVGVAFSLSDGFALVSAHAGIALAGRPTFSPGQAKMSRSMRFEQSRATEARKTHSNDAFLSPQQAKVSRGMAFFAPMQHRTPQNTQQRHNNDGDLSLPMGWEAVCRCVVVSLLFLKGIYIYIYI